MPQVEAGKAAVPKTEIGSHHLSLRSGMADAALALTNPGDRETSSRAANGQVVASRRSLGCRATSEVCVREQEWLYILRFVTNPTHHVYVVGRIYVTHKSMKLTVTIGRPACDVAR